MHGNAALGVARVLSLDRAHTLLLGRRRPVQLHAQHDPAERPAGLARRGAPLRPAHRGGEREVQRVASGV